MNKEEAMVNAASSVANAAGSVARTANEILTTYLVKALDKTGNVIDKAVDMVQEQAPLLVQEVLRWYFAYNLILFICGLVIILTLVAINVKHWNWNKAQSKLMPSERSSWYYDVDAVTIRMVLSVFQIFPIVGAIHMMNLQWLKIWIAPRLWLIEYTAGLLKSHT